MHAQRAVTPPPSPAAGEKRAIPHGAANSARATASATTAPHTGAASSPNAAPASPCTTSPQAPTRAADASAAPDAPAPLQASLPLDDQTPQRPQASAAPENAPQQPLAASFPQIPQPTPQPVGAFAAYGTGVLPADASALIFQRYRPLGTIGTGGFASVERCLDTRLKRLTAIKRISLRPEHGKPDPREIARAQDEAQKFAQLQNASIVTIYNIQFDKRYAYLIMEYVDGMSLADFLGKVSGSSLTYDETAAVAEALVEAVGLAHEKGMLHLDIKPANILIDRKGNVKLTDFGTAAFLGASNRADATGGTVGYMPPEQITDGVVSPRSDLFSLAAVLYEALCGQAPFKVAKKRPDETVGELAQRSLRKIKKGVTPPSELLSDIPPAAEAALLQALSPNADDRQPDVEDFARAFLPELGSPAAGRRSLAHMIALLDAGENDNEAEEGAPQAWEYDPELGYLGARWRPAKRVALGLAAAAGTALSVNAFIAPATFASPLLEPAVCLAIAAAAGFAPQIGSALVFAGFMVALASAAPLPTVVTAGAASFVVLASWWLTWGRTRPAASAAVLALSGAALALGDPLAAAGPVAVAAAYALEPAAAAGSVAVGLAFSQLMGTAAATGFAAGPAQLAEGFASAPLLAALAGYALLAAGASACLRGATKRPAPSGRPALYALVCVAAGIVVVLLKALANPMEIAATPGGALAAGAGAGVLSSIIGGILICAFGEPQNGTEGERP